MLAWKQSILVAIQKPVSFSSIKLLSTSKSSCQTTVQSNYYEILDVPKSATQKEIREAYIKKSKELHPDAQDEDSIKGDTNASFSVVNEAYEVLSKPAERREYNKKLRMQGMREAQHHYYHHNASNATYGDRIDLSHMSPEDRAKHMGYDVDPQFQYGRDTYLVAGLCVVIIVAGYCMHFRIAKMTSEKHSRNLAELTAKLTEEENNVRTQAMSATLPTGKSGNASHRDWLLRNDNENGDLVKAFDNAMLKRQAKKARQIPVGEDKLDEKDTVNHEKVVENRTYTFPDGTLITKSVDK